MNRLTSLLIFIISSTSLLAGNHYEEARKEYAKGPTSAGKVIELLEKQLKEDPEHEESIRLLAITYFGIEKPKEALLWVDKAIALSDKDKSISPTMLMLEARALFLLGRKDEAKKILDVYWAFWQKDKKLKGFYDYYYPRCQQSSEKKQSEQDVAPDGE